MKIYIHHLFSESIFYKLFHNTTERNYNIINGEGIVYVKYDNINFELIFKQKISFEEDGLHILDYFTTLMNSDNDPKIGHIEKDEYYMEKEIQQVFSIYKNLLKNAPSNQHWIITYFRTEKILQTYDTIEYNEKWNEIETILMDLKNHYIVTDNMFLNSSVQTNYPNFHYALTNTIFQWNEMIAIRWMYEFKQIYDKLNFDYDLMYSVRNHKLNRVLILNELSKIKNDRLLLHRSDSLQNIDYQMYSQKVEDISLNSQYGNYDFDNINYIENISLGNDLFFRILSKAKMQILCESWSWGKKDYISQYLSEKTFGLILAGIPFISTHEYPLKMLEIILDVPPHPFFNESLKCKANSKLFATFVKTFMENFDENYILCKEWSDLVHNKLVYKLNTENSLLDLIINDKLRKEFIIKKSLI